MGEKITLLQKWDELDFFLDDNHPENIHNRMMKLNLSLKVPSVTNFLSGIVKQIPSGNSEYQYHAECSLEELKTSMTAFLKKGNASRLFSQKSLLWEIPKGYQFYQCGINLNDAVDGKNQFGNFEIKFIPEHAVIVQGENPDRMLVINLHICPQSFKSDYYFVAGSLADKAMHKEINDFFKCRALKRFDLKNPNEDVFHAIESNFKGVDHPLSKENLKRHINARAAIHSATPTKP